MCGRLVKPTATMTANMMLLLNCGYGIVNKFCDWLFTSKHSHSTAIAPNQAGYDGRSILQWCLNKGLHPSGLIRQGSRIMYMEFAEFQIRFVDSLHFFLEPLGNLITTYNIDTLKRFFSHFPNTPENRNYIGKVHSEDMYGVKIWQQILTIKGLSPGTNN